MRPASGPLIDMRTQCGVGLLQPASNDAGDRFSGDHVGFVMQESIFRWLLPTVSNGVPAASTSTSVVADQRSNELPRSVNPAVLSPPQQSTTHLARGCSVP